MLTTAQSLMAASAAICLGLGTAHLWLTFATQKFHPRDPETEVRMRQDSPMLTRRTTMWRAWIGFNASHSLGAMLFGLLYGFLALTQGELLFESYFLRGLGLLLLATYLLLGRLYWFSVPFRGLLLASACYVAALVLG